MILSFPDWHGTYVDLLNRWRECLQTRTYENKNSSTLNDDGWKHKVRALSDQNGRAIHYLRSDTLYAGLSSLTILDMYYIRNQVGLVDSPWKYWRRDAEVTAEVATVTDLTEHPEQTLNEFFGREQPRFNKTKGPTYLIEHNQTLVIGATQT